MNAPVSSDYWQDEKNKHLAKEIHEKFKHFCKDPPDPRPMEGLTAEFAHHKFTEFDLNSDGELNSGEFAVMMIQLGIEQCRKNKPGEMEVDILEWAQAAFDAYDRDQDGHLNRKEFDNLFKRLLIDYPKLVPEEEFAEVRRVEAERLAKARQAVEDTNKEFEMLNLDTESMRRIFNLFDRDGGGTLDVAEIAAIVAEMGIPDYERDGYIGFIERNQAVSDEDADGTVEFDEFCVLIQSLVTCKMNRAYRQQVLAMKKGPGKVASIAEEFGAKPVKKKAKFLRGTTKFMNQAKNKYSMDDSADLSKSGNSSGNGKN